MRRAGMSTHLRTLPPVGRTAEWHKGWAERDVLVQPSQDAAVKEATVTAPNMPPEVLQAPGGRVLELLVGGGVD